MASYNKVVLIGNLTRDVQLSYLPSQTAVAEFGIAVNSKWKDKDGQPREEVMFIDVRAYGKQAETINQYVSKGKCILVEGRLQLDQWEGKDGTKRSKHRIALDKFSFIGGKDDRPQAKPAEQPTQQPAPQQPYGDLPPDEDIPFN